MNTPPKQLLKTIRIDPDLYQDFFTFCKDHDKVLKAVTERLIKEWLVKEKAKEK